MPLPTPTFSGIALFGIAVKMKVAEINPVRVQQTRFAGVDGVLEMRLGEDGAWTTVHGRLTGSTYGVLAANRGLLRQSTRWGKQDFYDNEGNYWPFVRMDTVQWDDNSYRWDPGGNGYQIDYSCRLFHAILP